MPTVFLKSDPSKAASTGTITLPKPRAHVYFRPSTGFQGEFGFDWMRTGDTAVNGDSAWYKDLLLATSKGNYSKLVGKYKDPFKHPTRDGDKYLVPVVNLLEGKTAKFSLKIEVKKEPKKLFFRDADSLFEIDPPEINTKSLGMHSLKDHVKIKCKELIADAFVDVMADDELAGRIKFKANNKSNRYIADIVFVYVTTNLDGALLPKIPVAAGCSDVLKKYLNQAFVEPNMKYELLNLGSDAKLKTDFSKNGKLLENKTEDLLKYIDSAFVKKDKKNTYSNYFRVYFVSEDAGGLYGRALGIPSKSALVLKVGFGDSTVAHELLHAMGLYHSFDDDGEFAFTDCKTDNIMDYSDINKPPINVVSTWQWQWELIRKGLKKVT